MLKAQQNQLAQSANIDLVNIRTAEIEYFVQFFTNFGTQCALIAGFQLSSICQVDTSGAARWSAYLYWISSALCICLSLHVLLCSVYSTVFGQGLALRGPTGSMVRAVDGMCAEQYEIIYIFSGNVFFLGCSTIATYYVVMDEYGAHACTAITVIAMYYWYRYCLRIYNRFKYVEPAGRWSTTDRDSEIVDKPRSTSKDHHYGGRASSKDRKKKRIRSLFPRIFNQRTKSFSSQAGDHHSDSRVMSGASHPGESPSGHQSFTQQSGSRVAGRATGQGPLYAGYVIMTVPGMFGEKQVRYYMVLEDVTLRWYEHKKQSETDSDQQSVNTRPLHIEDYEISTTKISQDVFGIDLTPHYGHDSKKIYHFRCDTYDDLQGWVNAFQAAMRPLSRTSMSDQRTALLQGALSTAPGISTDREKPKAVQSRSGHHEYFTSNASDILGSDGESDTLLRRNKSHTPFASGSKL